MSHTPEIRRISNVLFKLFDPDLVIIFSRLFLGVKNGQFNIIIHFYSQLQKFDPKNGGQIFFSWENLFFQLLRKIFPTGKIFFNNCQKKSQKSAFFEYIN